MLVELHVVDLGIVADLDLVLGPGLTAITGETGAGKTLLVEALELLVGGRADASLVRDGADRSARRRSVRRTPRPASEIGARARCVPRDGRSRAYVDGRLATVGELAEAAARARRPARPARAPVAARPRGPARRARSLRGRPALDALGAYRAARARPASSTPSSRALGGDERARAREIDLLRFQVRRDRRRRHRRRRRRRAARGGGGAARRRGRGPRRARRARTTAIEGPALDALGDALAALDGRAPFAELDARGSARAQAELADVAQELRREAERVADDPGAARAACASRRHQLRELGRKYGDRSPT